MCQPEAATSNPGGKSQWQTAVALTYRRAAGQLSIIERSVSGP